MLSAASMKVIDVCKPQQAGYYAHKPKITGKVYGGREKALKAKGGVGKPEVTGSCYCGACRFEVKIFPGELQHCYCNWCRKFSGKKILANIRVVTSWITRHGSRPVLWRFFVRGSCFQTWACTEGENVKWTDGRKLRRITN